MARKLAASNLGIDHSAREALEDFHEPPRFERWTLPPTRSCGTRWPSVNLLGFCLNAPRSVSHEHVLQGHEFRRRRSWDYRCVAIG